MRLVTVLSLFLLSVSPTFAGDDGQHAANGHPTIDWGFEGPLGTLDKQAAQRGYQVYKEVCAACHSMNLVAYRSLAQIGFTEPEIKALAAEKQIKDGPGDDGEMFDRPGRPSDPFAAPYPNEQAARAANGGAYPPDLSLMTKARADGVNYVHNLLMGYTSAKYYRCTESWPQGECKRFEEADEAAAKADKERVKGVKDARAKLEENWKAKSAAIKAGAKPLDPLPELSADEQAAMKPGVRHCMHISKEKAAEIVDGAETGRELEVEKCAELAEGKYYNPYFPGGQISMPPPLNAGQVTFIDGTEASAEQMSRDVTTFMQWAAEPEMEHRKAMGIKVILFLIIASMFLYAAKRRVWRNIH